MEYIWQKDTWPRFRWNPDELLPFFARAKRAQGTILGYIDSFNLQEQGDLLVKEVLTTSAIEGETLDPNMVRSSVARRLGLATAGLPETAAQAEGLVSMLLDATNNYTQPMTRERLWSWQAALFPTGYSGVFKVRTGAWRDSSVPMQVISGSMGKERVHYEAPPTSMVEDEMNRFITWWNNPPETLDGLFRAGISHFWLVSIHPFVDGNGRVSRAIADMALAQDEQTGKRLYSISSQIMKDRSSYYDVLERTQKGDGDVTEWLAWFFEMFEKSIEESKKLISKSIFIGKFYQSIGKIVLNERQRKVLGKLLECYPDEFQGGLTNKKYVSMTKTSSETAKRDLKDLVGKELIIPGSARGRSMNYQLKTILVS